MEIRINASGPNTLLTFSERVNTIMKFQKEVAELTGIKEWGPDFKRRMDIYSDEIIPVVMRAVKSIVNVKSVAPRRYEKISDDEVCETSSSVNFNYKKIFISYSLGGSPDGMFLSTVSSTIYNDLILTAEIRKELFRLFIRRMNAFEANYSDENYRNIFKGKGNVDMGTYIKGCKYQWTGLLTFIPESFFDKIDLSPYQTETMENYGKIVSMENVNDLELIFDFNKKVASLYGWELNEQDQFCKISQ